MNAQTPEPQPKFTPEWCEWQKQQPEFQKWNAERVATTKPVPSGYIQGSETLLESVVEDMSEKVLEGRLGEIVDKMTNGVGSAKHARAYAYLAVMTAAATMYPREVSLTQGTWDGRAKGVNSPTNLFTALIGEIHTGKSQAIQNAVMHLGLPPNQYSSLKAGSAEGLISRLSKISVPPQLLNDLDEWEHLIKKASIEGSTFYTIMNSAFYSDDVNLVVKGGKHIGIKCEMSFIGGIVESMYGELLGSGANDGFADRLLQGRCPTGYVFNYEEPDITATAIDWIPVRIDKSVTDLVNDWKKEMPGMGRVGEIAIRCAKISASADGRAVLYAKDMDAAKALVAEQMKIRAVFKPNVGETPEAKMGNAILAILPSNGAWVPVKPIYGRVHAERWGAGVFRHAIENLARSGHLEFFRGVGASPGDFARVGLGEWNGKVGRKPDFVRRLPE